MTKIKELRLTHNIKPTDLASMLSISVQAYYKYENGTNEPNIENLIKLASFYETSIDNIIGYREVDSNKQLSPTQLSIINLVKSLDNTQVKRIDAFIKGMLNE